MYINYEKAITKFLVNDLLSTPVNDEMNDFYVSFLSLMHGIFLVDYILCNTSPKQRPGRMPTSSIDFNKRNPLPRPLPPRKTSDHRNSSPPTQRKAEEDIIREGIPRILMKYLSISDDLHH
ncbi:hypothetical protein CEXT_505511 [Caerostris extrusa]|uniref:Uncharacterized protein n=1 Tax=Caerostris extrusa TaxID=172846 RepID=A0AAV4VN44_CAEEX|nr:hypothetical protein CEXT_505511 [Caerostris extrusa]